MKECNVACTECKHSGICPQKQRFINELEDLESSREAHGWSEADEQRYWQLFDRLKGQA